MAPRDTDFVGSVPEVYDRVLVPLIFEEHAADLFALLGCRGLVHHRGVLEFGQVSRSNVQVAADNGRSAWVIAWIFLVSHVCAP